ncbi:MAG: DUF3313 domain-containing protein [Halioglobus sp.]
MRLAHLSVLVFSVLLTNPSTLLAQESGFLPDYEGLKFAPGEFGGKTVPVPGVTEKMASIQKIMIDQPEIFVAKDSAYKGMKPDDARALAEALREALITNMKDKERLVEEPGPDVLYLRIAISDLHLKKKKRRLVSYTPVGIVAHTAKSIVTSNLMKKIDLVGATVEMEALHSITGEHFGSLVLKHAPPGKDSPDEATWENLLSNFDALSKQVVCRLANSRLLKEERSDCKILDSYQEG